MALVKVALIGPRWSRDLSADQWEDEKHRDVTARSDVTRASCSREALDTDGDARTTFLGKIRSFHLIFVHICHVLASVAVVSFRSSFLAASELLNGFLRLFLRVVLAPYAAKMAADDTNSNTVVDNINLLNARKNFVCGVVEGEKPNLKPLTNALPPHRLEPPAEVVFFGGFCNAFGMASSSSRSWGWGRHFVRVPFRVPCFWACGCLSLAGRACGRG